MKSLKHKLIIFLTKGLFKRVKFLMWFPLWWCMEKMDLGECVLIGKLSTTFFIHEEVRFNIGQSVEQYEKQANEGYQRLVFDPGRWIQLHIIKERCSKLRTRIDGPSKIIKKIGKNAYKLEFPDDNNILPTFNVKDLRPYHGEDLRASLFPQLWGIDARASTTNIENSILIMENSDLGTLETLIMFLNPRI